MDEIITNEVIVEEAATIEITGSKQINKWMKKHNRVHEEDEQTQPKKEIIQRPGWIPTLVIRNTSA